MPNDQTPRIGQWCKDGGKCHHGCAQNTGCFRQECCAPLSISGLDDHWRTPQEAAEDLAKELALCSKQTVKSTAIASL